MFGQYQMIPCPCVPSKIIIKIPLMRRRRSTTHVHLHVAFEQNPPSTWQKFCTSVREDCVSLDTCVWLDSGSYTNFSYLQLVFSTYHYISGSHYKSTKFYWIFTRRKIFEVGILSRIFLVLSLKIWQFLYPITEGYVLYICI